MENSGTFAQAKHGTAGGFLLVLLANINSGDLLKTIVLAATGAAVSYLVSFGMQWVRDKLK